MAEFSLLTSDQKESLQQSTEAQELQKILNIFNLNLKKKELLRVEKLNDLQDALLDQAAQRVEKHGDEFSNRDLIEYFKAFDGVLQKTPVNTSDFSAIQITQNQLNINMSQSEFDSQERQKIFSAVQALLASAQNNSDDNLEVLVDDNQEDI